MVDTELLDEAIVASGKRLGYLAEKLGITIHTFRSRRIGKSDFLSDEITILCDELNIRDLNEKEKIFFKKM